MASCMPWTWRAASCEWSRSSDDHLRVSDARRLGPTRSPLTFHSRAVVAVSSGGRVRMCRVEVAGRLVAEVEHGIVDQRPSDATRCLFATEGSIGR